MTDARIESAVSAVPPGPWAVGVSGGADSVALLAMLRGRADLQLHIVHLDHQTRGEASTGDARFAAELADAWGLPAVVAMREQIEPKLAVLPGNPSARYRACRLELFRQVVRERSLGGVILAHHADDQAETVLQRLIRGSSYTGLAGMRPRATIGGLLILRPLLRLRRSELREFLAARKLNWREDASNQSDDYQRNRLRKILDESPGLFESLIELGDACRDLRDWSRGAAPMLSERFAVTELSRLPRILADESARRWLIDQGAPAGEISPSTLDRLYTMVTDAASPARQEFPGSLIVRRRAGMICVGSP